MGDDRPPVDRPPVDRPPVDRPAGVAATPQTFTVPETLDGERIDKVVASVLGLSRSVARGLVEAGEVAVGAPPEPVTEPARRVRAGERVAVASVPGPEVLEAEEAPFVVRHEEPDLLVVDKPPGLVVHPGAGKERPTLASGLLHRFPEIEGVGQEGRWGIVHRLDRETSGLLVVARTPEAYETLVAAMAERSIRRRYLALVEGTFDIPAGIVDAPLGRDPRRPSRMTVRLEGRPARTRYRVLAAWRDADRTLLEVELETGRTHQIRAHLASIGHPVVGDRLYGGHDGPGSPGRVWLHAYRLDLPHPRTGEPLSVVSPLPDDLAGALAALGPPDDGAVPSAEGPLAGGDADAGGPGRSGDGSAGEGP